MPESDPSTQIENYLDICIRNWRTVELSSVVDDSQRLRQTATDMNEAIDELELKLLTLKKLAYDVCTQRFKQEVRCR